MTVTVTVTWTCLEKVGSARAGSRDQRHGGRRRDRQGPADQRRRADVRRGTQALHRGDQRGGPRREGGRRHRDRGHGLPRRRRGLHVQLADPRGSRPGCEFVVQEEWTEYTGFLEEGCDAALFVGMHAMAGTADGVLNHTVSGQSWHNLCFNGTPVGETGINAALCGTWGCPVLLVTGDEASCREGKELLGDGLTTVSVKKGLGQLSARMHRPRAGARADRRRREAGALRPESGRAVRPRQALRGQGRVQAHDRGPPNALPARRRVPRRPHDRLQGRRLVDGLEAVLLRRPLGLHDDDRRRVQRRQDIRRHGADPGSQRRPWDGRHV